MVVRVGGSGCEGGGGGCESGGRHEDGDGCEGGSGGGNNCW